MSLLAMQLLKKIAELVNGVAHAVVEINDCPVESLDAAGTGKKRQNDMAEQIKCFLNINQGKAPFKSQVGYLRDKAVEFILFAENQETAVGCKGSADGLQEFRFRSLGIPFADFRSAGA